jgi:dTDP-4-amino-4,6-dideoxygalactose transaminase
MPEFKIPIAKPEFTKKDFEAILEPLKSGWVVQGPKVKEFEEKFKNFTGSKYALATSSCTTALHLSLAALEIGPGDEVIVPAFTWVATANVVEQQKAKVIFCDIDLNTFNIDVSQVEKKISNNTKAIIPVHLFGLAAHMDRIQEIADKHNIYVVEDAACGFGSYYKKKHVGNFGIAGCFSFHPRKALTTGEGGMILTSNEVFAERLRAMRDHGATESDLQRHQGNKPYLLPEFPYLGFNYRMTDIQASIGCTQMDRLEEILSQRKYWSKRYNEELKDIKWLNKAKYSSEYIHGYQSYVCLFMPDEVNIKNIRKLNKKRNEFMDYLLKRGISTRPCTHAVHSLHYYKQKYKINPEDLPNALFADKLSIAFPIFSTLKEDEFNHITDSIKSWRII